MVDYFWGDSKPEREKVQRRPWMSKNIHTFPSAYKEAAASAAKTLHASFHAPAPSAEATPPSLEFPCWSISIPGRSLRPVLSPKFPCIRNWV